MPDSPIWERDPHTAAKHRILEEYLKAWFPILGSRYQKIIYIDGFAGPGIYEKDEYGSPVIALDCIINHTLYKSATQYMFLFIESDKERAEILNDIIMKRYPNKPKNIVIQVKHGDFETVMKDVLKSIGGNNLAPTFAFLDPFGYSGLSFDLISKILAYKRCEVFINFAYNSINRFAEARDTREEIFDNLFGTDDWRGIRDIRDPPERCAFLTSLYTQQLQKHAKYVRSFEMINNYNQTSYYLYYATNHILGLKQMKIAMWKVDPRGLYKFADTTDVGQKFLFSYEDEDTRCKEQAEIIQNQFTGKAVSVKEIETFCIECTAFPTLWKGSLRCLESEGVISVTNRQRRMTYPDKCYIRFNGNM